MATETCRRWHRICLLVNSCLTGPQQAELPETHEPLALSFAEWFFTFRHMGKAQHSYSSANLTNLLLMNLFQQNFISTCTVNPRKADSPAERNHPSRKSLWRSGLGGSRQAAKQMNDDNRNGNWITVYTAISPKSLARSACAHVNEQWCRGCCCRQREPASCRGCWGTAPCCACPGEHQEAEAAAFGLWMCLWMWLQLSFTLRALGSVLF